MQKMTERQLSDRLAFVRKYIDAQNAASGSEVDANSNVTNKTIATLESELYKGYSIQLNRKLVCDKLEKMFGSESVKNYLLDIDCHNIYVHDETSLKPYCASVTLYPYLLEGTKCLGGVSKAPTNLQSFCGSFVNLVYQLASNFAGAIATVEFLNYFDYFARKQYGDNYQVTHAREVKQELQGVVYALNQPASARGDQSVFWNISVFDHPYMEEMFGNFFFSDGTQTNYASLMGLQILFMEWFSQERKKELLTFPVLTASFLTTSDGFADEGFVDTCARKMAAGLSFFVYMSDKVDSLASCCRLRNELADNTFSYTLGAGGVVTGSSQVITLNMNRILQDADSLGSDYKTFDDAIKDHIDNVHKYLMATKEVYKDYINAGLLPAYTAGFMSLDKQFLTIGINGMAEAAEALGYTVGNNEEYKVFLQETLSIFKQKNKEALKEYGCRFNTEFVPAENLGVKNAKWDKEDGYEVHRDCYNSYFYLVEDENTTILDKIQLYGSDITNCLDGGSALHLNLQQLMTKDQALKLFNLCRINHVPYWTTNVKSTICNKCGYIDPQTRTACSKCGSTDIEYATRIIGYLKPISKFSLERQREAAKRFYI